jgi:hypothetical protein
MFYSRGIISYCRKIPEYIVIKGKIAAENGKIYTQYYEIGQFRNETAGCSSAERGRA